MCFKFWTKIGYSMSPLSYSGGINIICYIVENRRSFERGKHENNFVHRYNSWPDTSPGVSFFDSEGPVSGPS